MSRTEDAPALPDAPSFRTVFESELGFVWHALRRLGVAARDLDDQTQEVFVIVHRQLGKYDPSRPLRTWLLGIVYRRASDYRRLVRHQREVYDADAEVSDPSLGADEQLVAHQARNLLERALDAVDPDRRAVLVLHDFEGLVMPEIAAMTDVPLRTAYSRLRVAREELGAAVKRLRLREERP